MDSEQTWDERYSESDQIWSGKVNTVLADAVADLTPGTALDIGSGEGADVLWLARRGWRVTGIDVSRVAVERAEQAAEAQGVPPEQAQFMVADVTRWRSPGTYQLVTAAFLHSRGTFDRDGALQIATDAVASGGYILVISHAEVSPWAAARHESADDHAHQVTTPESELELLQLDPDHWSVEIAELRSREVVGPDGEQATLHDTVILAQRRSG